METYNKRATVWIIVGLLILLIPLAMSFTNEVQWSEAIAYAVLLLAIGVLFELWQWLKTHTIIYRFAFITGFIGVLLIGWVNGAVGIIGSEDNPANLLYGAVFAVGLIGSLVSRFKPSGMSNTLFMVALVQILIPLFALLVWPANTSWSEAGVVGIFIINAVFAILFISSGLLFRKATKVSKLNTH